MDDDIHEKFDLSDVMPVQTEDDHELDDLVTELAISHRLGR